MQKKFVVNGMSCSACSARVERTVRGLEGVNDVEVNLLAKSMVVDFDEAVINKEAISEAVTKSGYNTYESAGINYNREGDNEEKDDEGKLWKRLKYSICFLIPLMYVSMGHMAGFPVPELFHVKKFMYIFQLFMSASVIAINREIFVSGIKSVKDGAPNMDTLISMGSGAAMLFAIITGEMYFESAAMILTLVTLGKYLEERAKGKTSEALNKLIDMAPKKAVILRNGKEVEIPVSDVKIGDLLVSKPGEAIAVDGTVTEGFCTVDESIITGESLPVDKGMGSSVIGATVNKSGYIVYRAEKIGEDTAFYKIIKLVEDASASKGPASRIADRISGIFVPVVIGISVLVFLIWIFVGKGYEFALTAAISVLVISCPCSLGLATPAAVMTGMGKGAENGILIKSAAVLETVGKADVIIIDKTGTITEGKPVVTDIYVRNKEELNKVDLRWSIKNDTPEGKLLRITGGIEAKSEHPIGAAIVKLADEKRLIFSTIERFEIRPGKGAQGYLDEKLYKVGTEKYILENSECEIDNDLKEVSSILRDEGKTVIFCADESHILGIVAVADVVRKSAKEAIAEFNKFGMDTLMLTGDNKGTAEFIKKQVELKKAIAEALPEDKEKITGDYQQKGFRTVFIGDGINDAPSLARADVGIAIGNGTDVAMESADIVLVRNDLMDGVRAIKLSRIVIRNIKQNLFWAFFYNIIGIPIAAGILYPAFGLLLSPMIAAAAMSVSSICVVLNALRIRGIVL